MNPGKPRRLPPNGPPIRELTDLRWTDHLQPHEERDIIRAAKAGDAAARNRLYKCFHKKLLKIAGNIKYAGPSFDDRLSAAAVGFWKAFAGYDSRRNNGFRAYAAKFVRGAVVDLVHDWHRHGGKGETQAERKNRSANCPSYQRYNTIEGLREDDADGNPIGGSASIAPDDGLSIDDTQRRINLRLMNVGRKFGVPRECWLVDGDPRTNGGRWPTKSRFKGWNAFGYPGGIPRAETRCDNALTLREYLKANPTLEKYKIRAPSRRLGLSAISPSRPICGPSVVSHRSGAQSTHSSWRPRTVSQSSPCSRGGRRLPTASQ